MHIRISCTVNPFLTMDSPITINWMCPLSRSDLYFSSHFSMKFLCANRIAPDATLQFLASHLGLCCMPMSHKGTPGLNGLKMPKSHWLFSKNSSQLQWLFLGNRCANIFFNLRQHQNYSFETTMDGKRINFGEKY